MASPKEGENGEGGGEPPQTNNGIGPEGEDSKCTKFGGGGDTTGETAVSDDTKPAETAEMSVTESDAAIISRKRNRSSGSLSSCDSNTSFKRIKYENTSQVANLKSALSQLNLEFKEFVFTAPPGFVFEPGISVEAEYAGYYMVGNTKISGTGNKPYHCQRSAAQKALEYIENK